ncbi:ABC transporter ATP-binding protein [Gilvimarinus sp. F26214L]|uniref:ABC transporter ATP-binding protein n=1 Tax=Gilvimarinus sp. DZF01 TaxID=3461371 RepID=UPI004046238B
METLIRAKGLSKSYGRNRVLDNIDLEIQRGRIVGLIGHNGAGKTTALKCLLGLAPCEGDLEVMGLAPARDRARLMEQACFIADTSILPQWITGRRALDFLEGVHPRFDRSKAQAFLDHTDIDLNKDVGKLSKGMVTQLHLALVMAIDVPLLVLDEPTLGLDILYRKQFYTSLLNDYFDEQRTIIITTHQVEEVEALLTDLVFLRRGRVILDTPMDEVADRFTELLVAPEQLDAARALNPIAEHAGLGRTILLFEGVSRARLEPLGETRIPGIADLFVAKMQ